MLKRTGEKVDPDLSKCRTSSVGAVMPGANHEMYYCSIDHADCRYAMPFGFDLICKHQDGHTFVIPEDEDTETPSESFL
jgi:hypothetical protein